MRDVYRTLAWWILAPSSLLAALSPHEAPWNKRPCLLQGSWLRLSLPEENQTLASLEVIHFPPSWTSLCLESSLPEGRTFFNLSHPGEDNCLVNASEMTLSRSSKEKSSSFLIPIGNLKSLVFQILFCGGDSECGAGIPCLGDCGEVPRVKERIRLNETHCMLRMLRPWKEPPCLLSFTDWTKGICGAVPLSSGEFALVLGNNESLCLRRGLGPCGEMGPCTHLSCVEPPLSGFMTVICLGLFCLLLLLVFLIGVSRRKYYGKGRSSEPGPGDGVDPSSFEKKKNGGGYVPPPRSLTEDDLEHISTLPRQEILLLYFPDSPRFKDLNAKLKAWLLSLDVNEVSDIYEQKVPPGEDPQSWLWRHLARHEQRIILVCSRLAFEALSAVPGGSHLPAPETESGASWTLLTAALAYLEGQMRGNYRNLICVRYEDIKVCSRKYSSEAFNIVPGTEYVLPQHLEDVYRWIHPRNPRPEAWCESNPFVNDFLKSIRNYQHHDENIFTVQFSHASGEI